MWLLDSCFRRNDNAFIEIPACFADRHTLTWPFLQDLASHSSRTGVPPAGKSRLRFSGPGGKVRLWRE